MSAVSSPSKLAIQPRALLIAYLTQLAIHPLRTKSITSGVLCALQEITSNHLAGVPTRRVSKDEPLVKHALARSKVDVKALKMFIYGSLISAPLGHLLAGKVQAKLLEKLTGTTAKIARLLSSNLLIAPIQTTVFLTSMAIIDGATSIDAIKKTIKAGFFPMIRMTWVLSPIVSVLVTQYVPPMFWPPVLNLVSFSIGLIFGTHAKRARLAAITKAKAKKAEEERKKREEK